MGCYIETTIVNAAMTALKYDKCSLEPRKEWITFEIDYLIKERRKFKDLTCIKNYSLLCKELRSIIVRKCKDAKEKYLEEKCKVIDVQMKTYSQDVTYGSEKNVQ